MNGNDSHRDPVIVTAVRTAVGKAKKGSLATTSPIDNAAVVVREIMKRVPELDPEAVDDVIIGCAMPEGEQGLNAARQILLLAGLPNAVPGQTVNRFCSSGLQTIANAAMAIMSGMADVVIAGGTESMSMVPMTGNKFAPSASVVAEVPEVYMNMGLTAENVAEKYDISRLAQDEFALRSHQNAAEAINKGLFKDEIAPVNIRITEMGDNTELVCKTLVFNEDEGVRFDTSLKALSSLKPVFKVGGTVTAGNSSQMSDGAAAVLVMSRAKAEKLGVKPIARFIGYGVGGVPPEIMGIGPIEAVPKALKISNLKLEDIGLIELNEAFAAQSVAVIRELGMNLEIVNVNGGAIALGHPLGCTGAKLTTQLLYEMRRRDVKYGMVTMCIGGGMGAAGIFENLN